MCGISGLFSSNKSIERSLHKMSSFLEHRGPDNADFYLSRNFGLAHNRLSIIDLSKAANQPMQDNSGRYVITFNGEIFNFKELKQQLIVKGSIFKTNSDTEILLEGFVKDGKSFLEKIRGFYSFCIYDTIADKAIFSRDCFGKKPLYYFESEDEFIFSSEIKPIKKIINPNVSIDYDSMSHFLWKGYYVDGSTAYSEIKSILPGQIVEVSRQKDNLKVKKKSSNFFLKLSKKEKKRNINEIDRSLKEAINYRFVSDVPFSFLLSGGVDSSLVAAISSSLKKETKIETHYLGYDDDHDDTFKKHAAFVSNKINSNHHIHTMELPKFEEVIPLMLRIFDEPFGDYSAIPSNEIYKKISKFNKVAISGDGADEIFAGYKDSRLFYLKSILPSLNFNNLKLLSLCFYLLNSKFSFIRKLTYFFLIFLGNDEILSMATYKGGWNLYYRKKYMTKEGFKITGKENVELNEKNSFKNSGKSILERYINYDLKRLAYDFLVKIDRTSMQNSLEIRSPFLDKYFVNKLFPSNPKYLFSLKTNKKILKKLLEKYNLQKIAKTPKQGFTPPLEKWIISEESKYFLNKIFKDKDSIVSKLFKLNKLKKMTKTDSSLIINKSRLWFLMILYIWHKENFLKD
jgi:asparagine synthase (glutamine-hydrolysing)